MRKVASLFDWYWVLLSIWVIGVCVIFLLKLTPDSIVVGLIYLCGLIGGIFWFFSGATTPRSPT